METVFALKIISRFVVWLGFDLMSVLNKIITFGIDVYSFFEFSIRTYGNQILCTLKHKNKTVKSIFLSL
jgi:hypothetical protein